MHIILASKSAARKAMLDNAGLKFSCDPADIDEQALISGAKEPERAAILLAQEKAKTVSQRRPKSLVIGSDQILVFENEILNKAETQEAAKEKLKRLRGKTHRLVSAVSVVWDGKSVWSALDSADLTMRNFDDDFLDSYCKRASDDLLNCVGAYAIEGAGAWLFENVKGDYFTIMGMPLLPLLGYLREECGVSL